MKNPKIKIVLLPGGKMPKRQSSEAAGYDVSLRAIVSASEMDKTNPVLRKTLFDFASYPNDPDIARHVHQLNGEMVYRMDPGESVLAGIGFLTALPFPMFYWVAPRSGLASKWGITVTNAPGTVDADYRGEAGVLVFNRNAKPFDLRRDMRIAQIIFQQAIIPDMVLVSTGDELGLTDRSAGGFGSTGLGGSFSKT
ncbi:MAG: dUTP diphosphatase [bacterium]|nr:dUTP diphosphatase [bacterium]